MNTRNINEYLVCAESLIGGRPENQDNYDLCETPLGALVVVCDGMGGGPAGKTASTLATNAIINHVKAAAPSADPKKVLVDAVADANMTVIKAQLEDRSLMGMGTTCVVLLLCGATAYIIHVGDSRCYQLRGGKMVFRTNDHSLVGELVRNKSLTEEQARTAGNSNIITKAVGIRPTLEPEIDTVKVKPGDRFALLSDGIWGMLPQPDLIRYFLRKESIANIVADLTNWVDSAGKNKGNTHDNLTLAMVQVPDYKSARKTSQINDDSSERSRLTSSDIWTIVLFSAIVIGIGITSYLLIHSDESKMIPEPAQDETKTEIHSTGNVISVRVEDAAQLLNTTTPTESEASPQVAEFQKGLQNKNKKDRFDSIIRHLGNLSQCIDNFSLLVVDGQKSASIDTLIYLREKHYDSMLSQSRPLLAYCASDIDISDLYNMIKDKSTRNKLRQLDSRQGLETRECMDCRKVLIEKIKLIQEHYNDSISLL